MSPADCCWLDSRCLCPYQLMSPCQGTLWPCTSEEKKVPVCVWPLWIRACIYWNLTSSSVQTRSVLTCRSIVLSLKATETNFGTRYSLTLKCVCNCICVIVYLLCRSLKSWQTLTFQMPSAFQKMTDISGGLGCHPRDAGGPLCSHGTGTSPRMLALLSQWDHVLSSGAHSDGTRKGKKSINFSFYALFSCMFNSGNRAGCDDRYGEFKPPAERRHVHRWGCSRFPATQLHISGCYALSTHDQVKELL